MKNSHVYAAVAAVSLVLVAASALLAATYLTHRAAVCLPLLCGLVFSWSAVKAVLAAMEQQDVREEPAPIPVLRCRFA